MRRYICCYPEYCTHKSKSLLFVREIQFHWCRIRKNPELCRYSLPVQFVQQLPYGMLEVLKERSTAQPERT